MASLNEPENLRSKVAEHVENVDPSIDDVPGDLPGETPPAKPIAAEASTDKKPDKAPEVNKMRSATRNAEAVRTLL